LCAGEGQYYWIEVNYDTPVDVTAGAKIPLGGDGRMSNYMYAVAQTNVTKVYFRYYDSGLTSMPVVSSSTEFCVMVGSQLGYQPSNWSNVDIIGTIKAAGTSTDAGKTLTQTMIPRWLLVGPNW
jgi:hypothetical protein